MPGPGPDQPGQALPGGTPHAVRGVPGHRTVANPAQSSSVRYTWPTSVVCDSAVDGNIEIPSGGTPQDFHVFNMAVLVEKARAYKRPRNATRNGVVLHGGLYGPPYELPVGQNVGHGFSGKVISIIH